MLVSMNDPGLRKLTTETPGATRSTPRLASPMAENVATLSSAVVLMSPRSAAPTVIT